jgi:hypothetical protein
MIPAGSYERSLLDNRSDILTYTTDLLSEPLSLAGSVEVELYVQADSLSFDLAAVLSEIYADGRVLNLAQGYKRINEGEYPVTFSLQAIAVHIPIGHQLRLSISGSCFPAYPVNTGTGLPIHSERAIAAQVITLTLRSGAQTPSQVKLPHVAHGEEFYA